MWRPLLHRFACGTTVAFVLGLVALLPAAAQVMTDPSLTVTPVVAGLQQPTTMAFLGPNDFLVLEKATGRVLRVLGGVVQATPALDVNVHFDSERGMLGIAIDPATPPRVFLYYTETAGPGDTDDGLITPLGNRVYRYDWDAGTGTLINGQMILDLPVTPGPNHDGGVLVWDDTAGHLYLVIGDLNRNGQMQNIVAGPAADNTGGILRVNADGTPAAGNPFTPYCSVTTAQTCSSDPDCPGGETCRTNVARYFAYGIRNSFGMAFDPATGALWMTENGPVTYDEVNRVDAGFNSGWSRIHGPDSRDPQGVADLFHMPGAGITYSDPEFSWLNTIAPTGILFPLGTSWGPSYDDVALVADNNLGQIYAFPLDATRSGFVLSDGLTDLVADNATERNAVRIGQGFGAITDLERGPEAVPHVYVVSISDGAIYRISGAFTPADLSVTKTDGQATAIPGQTVAYTIVAANGGPAPVTGATVTDTLPAALTGATWTCVGSGGGTCTAGGTGNINDTVNLPVGASVTYTLSATIDPTATGSLSNTATVTPPGGVTDPVPGNNTATDVDTLTPQADLSITKTDGRTSAAPGQTISYTIVASNAGPSAAPSPGATVTDTVPPELTGATWSCIGSGGGVCLTANGTGDINANAHLPVGASVTFTLTATISPSATGSFGNTASVAPPSGVTDPVPGNDSATDTDALIACGSEVVMVPDGRLGTSTLAAGAIGWFGASLRIGNSYSVEFKNTTGATPQATLTLFSGDDACGDPSSLTTRDTTSIDPPGTMGAVRQSFTAAGTSTYFRARVENGSGSALAYSFSWSDTTMFSAVWNSGRYDTFYSFQNTTGTTLHATLSLLSPSGTLVTSDPLTIGPGHTATTSTQALGIPRDQSGTAKLTHDGPPGAILAEAAIANFSISPAYVQPVKFQAVREAR